MHPRFIKTQAPQIVNKGYILKMNNLFILPRVSTGFVWREGLVVFLAVAGHHGLPGYSCHCLHRLLQPFQNRWKPTNL